MLNSRQFVRRWVLQASQGRFCGELCHAVSDNLKRATKEQPTNSFIVEYSSVNSSSQSIPASPTKSTSEKHARRKRQRGYVSPMIQMMSINGQKRPLISRHLSLALQAPQAASRAHGQTGFRRPLGHKLSTDLVVQRICHCGTTSARPQRPGRRTLPSVVRTWRGVL